MEQLRGDKSNSPINPFVITNAAPAKLPNRFLRYGIAVFSVGVTLLISLLFKSFFEESPFLLFWAAVIVSVWYGNVGPGLVAILLSAIAVSYFFQRPYYELSIDSQGLLQLIVFVLAAIFAMWLNERRRQVENVIRRQGEWFHTILASIGDAIIVSDLEGRIVFLNSVAASLTGRSLQEALGQDIQSLFQMVNGYTRQPLENPAARALREGEIIEPTDHTTLISKDGTERAIDNRAAPVRDAAGGIIGAVLVFRNITARQQAEKALANVNERLSSTLESITDGYFALDDQWRFLELNPVAERIFGRRADELVGKVIWDEYPQSYGNEFYRQYHVAVTQRQPLHFEAHSNIVDQWFEAHVYPRLGRLDIYLRDITARKHAETALRQSEEQFRIAQDLSLDAFTILESVRDPDGMIVDFRWTYANSVAARILQHPIEKLIGRRLLEVLPGNKDQSELFERYVQVVETGHSHDLEIPYKAEGIHGWFRNMAVKLGDGVAVSFRDITARKKTEEMLQVRQQELETINQQLRSLFEQAPFGLVLFDPEPPYRVLTHNAAYQQFWSEPYRTEGVVGLHKRDFIPGFETSSVYDIFREVAQTGEGQSFSNYPFGGLDRGQTWWNWSLSPMFVDGKLTALVQVLVEVTEEVLARQQLEIELAERQRVEQVLRESEAMAQQQLAEIEAIYASAPVGLTVLDKELRYQRVNKLLAEMNGVRIEDHLGRTVREVIPLLADQVEPVIQQIVDTGEALLNIELKGETAAQPGVERFWVENWMPLVDTDGQVIGINIMAQEITEQKRADLRRQYMQELALALGSALTFAEVARIFVDKGVHMFGAAAGMVVKFDASRTRFEIIEAAGYPMSLLGRWQHFPLDTPGAPLAVSIRTNQPLWLESVEDRLAQLSTFPEAYRDTGHQAWVCLPLRAGREIIGGLGLSFPTPRAFDKAERDFMLTLADYCAQALERARLYDLEQQTRLVAEKTAARIERLQAMTAALAQAMTVEEVARIMVDQGTSALGAANGVVQLLDEQGTAFRLIHNAVSRLSSDELQSWQEYPADPAYPMTDVVLHKKALWFKSSDELIAHYPSVADAARTYSGAVIMLPILVRQKAIGGVTFVFNTPQTFDQDERDLVVALTQQCAQSLERVQLYEEAQLAAATRERERLARDLHDAVSQALFSANIIAESLPRQWQRDPEKALEGLVQLHQLTRGAQAEMRTLLLELRPTAILEADLKSLLPQLVDAVRSRKRITIASEIEEPEQLPPDVKIGLYRIAQEALNNIAKHSRATEAFVRLTSHNGQVKLVISDNGKGFDLDRVVATSLGLKIMHERAQAVGASLKIASESGQGTQVTVVWSG